jgi:putative transposase
MPASMTQVFVHYVWGTYQRNPWLTGQVRELAFRTIVKKCITLEAQVIALNGIEDHVHLLVKMPPTLTVAQLIGQAKGASSHAITHQWRDDPFKWQDGYGAFSVSETGVIAVRAYIADQQAHHHSTVTCQEAAALDPASSP